MPTINCVLYCLTEKEEVEKKIPVTELSPSIGQNKKILKFDWTKSTKILAFDWLIDQTSYETANGENGRTITFVSIEISTGTF